MDVAWWKRYRETVAKAFGGVMASSNAVRGVHRVGIAHPGNSGAGAIVLARTLGATRIYLLGFDCQHTAGRRHWHGDHPEGLGNAADPGGWLAHFREIDPAGIVNLSRETAIDAFPRGHIEDVLT